MKGSLRLFQVLVVVAVCCSVNGQVIDFIPASGVSSSSSGTSNNVVYVTPAPSTSVVGTGYVCSNGQCYYDTRNANAYTGYNYYSGYPSYNYNSYPSYPNYYPNNNGYYNNYYPYNNYNNGYYYNGIYYNNGNNNCYNGGNYYRRYYGYYGGNNNCYNYYGNSGSSSTKFNCAGNSCYSY
ncbi:hypothetical protein BV898_14593 [Hypsibius exemplaris]|uniref:Uncharacterized protein n=1 Tax=Hypsibius exemplaris TaxID=2072580 RepID=A0A9X6N9P0_HYPEX|nr:hypothetical protein BV898_14593 [Hypsibius exemplaris]